MGTTLVIQSHVVSSSVDHALGSRTAGLLFAANTFGAVVGAYGSVMVLVPSLGVRRTIIVATVLNVIAAGLGRMRTAENSTAATPKNVAPASTSQTPAPVSRLSVLLVMAALFTAGFAGLANEVAWTRAFILVAGPTVHAFAFVLGAIVLGLATGALISSNLLPYLGNPRLAFVLVQASVAIASAHVIRTLASMPLAYGEEVRRLIDQPEAIVGLQAEPIPLSALPRSGSVWRAFPARSASSTIALLDAPGHGLRQRAQHLRSDPRGVPRGLRPASRPRPRPDPPRRRRRLGPIRPSCGASLPSPVENRGCCRLARGDRPPLHRPDVRQGTLRRRCLQVLGLRPGAECRRCPPSWRTGFVCRGPRLQCIGQADRRIVLPGRGREGGRHVRRRHAHPAPARPRPVPDQ